MNKVSLAIDIGSTKICAIISEVKDEQEASIMGTGIYKSQGLKKGVITNIELASKAIRNSIEEANRVAGRSVNTATVSISGAYVKSLESQGIVNVPTGEVGIKDINRAIHTAVYNATILNEYEVVHALPYSFKLDEQDDIDNPLGMNGGRLEANIFLVTAQKSALNNLRKAIYGAGVEIENLVLNSYASSIAVLGEDEMTHGVCLVDMGGTTSNMIVHSGNSIKFSEFLGVGSSNITKDISKVLQTQPQIAEKLKRDLGAMLPNDDEDNIQIPKIGDESNMQTVPRSLIREIILARVEESLILLKDILNKSGLKSNIGSGLVLTGGFSQIDGFRDIALKIFNDMPVRVARPIELDGLFESLRDPSFATVLGLTLYASGKYTTYELDSNNELKYKNSTMGVAPQNIQGLDELANSTNNKTAKSVEPTTKNGNFNLNLKDGKEKTSKIFNVIKNLF